MSNIFARVIFGERFNVEAAGFHDNGSKPLSR
jgi:hypothetical protein